MTDLVAPDMAIGGLVLAAAVLYAAWHDYNGSQRYHRGRKKSWLSEIFD